MSFILLGTSVVALADAGECAKIKERCLERPEPATECRARHIKCGKNAIDNWKTGGTEIEIPDDVPVFRVDVIGNSRKPKLEDTKDQQLQE